MLSKHIARLVRAEICEYPGEQSTSNEQSVCHGQGLCIFREEIGGEPWEIQQVHGVHVSYKNKTESGF